MVIPKVNIKVERYIINGLPKSSNSFWLGRGSAPAFLAPFLYIIKFYNFFYFFEMSKSYRKYTGQYKKKSKFGKYARKAGSLISRVAPYVAPAIYGARALY
ncbi:MAG: hypothetical protein H7836_16175, partial [Magnetococcus sp. YQC-3]